MMSDERMMEKEYNPERGDLYFADLLQLLRRYLYVFRIAVLLTGALGFAVSKWFMTPKYETAVMMIVNTKQANTSTVTNDNITSAQNLVATYSVIIKSNTVLDRVIDDLQLDLTYHDLYDMVYVSAVDDTQIMRVAVRDTDIERSKRIVSQLVAIAPGIIVDAAEAGSCKVISKVATGEKPVYPNTKRNTAFAMAIGLLVSVLIVVIREVTKEVHIVDDSDVKKYLGLPILGVIPEIEGKTQ